MADTDRSNPNKTHAHPAESKRSGINWTGIMNYAVPVLTLVSGFVIGYLKYKTTNQTEIDNSKAQQAQYEDEIRKERSDFLQKCVPDLMSKDSDTRYTAEALLYALSLEDGPRADQVLAIINRYRPAGTTTLDTISPLENEQWGIVVGGNANMDEALAEKNTAKKHGFTSVNIYKIKNEYNAVVTGYGSKSAAMSQSFLARAALSDGARVVDLSDWCPDFEAYRDSMKSGIYVDSSNKNGTTAAKK